MNNNTLIEIAQEIRDTIKNYMYSQEDYGEIVKKKKRDVTRKIDMVAENALESALHKHGFSANVISEELGERIIGSGTPEFTLVFDPVDGTTNASRGIPFFCTSLAYSKTTDKVTFGEISSGVVCDILGNTYHAVKNKGAFLNGKRIKNEPKPSIKKVISIYSYGVPNIPIGILEIQKNTIIRILGSIALDMSFVAIGSIDGLIDVRDFLSGYDISASYLILKEAGGIITDINGNDYTDMDVNATGFSFACAKDKELHNKIISILQ
ncbi:MAG: inositol monophosphatase family protein [Methanosarcinales archaeon]